MSEKKWGPFNKIYFDNANRHKSYQAVKAYQLTRSSIFIFIKENSMADW